MAAAPAMMHSINEAGVLISVSDTWLAKLGYARHEAVGRLAADFLTPESRERALKETLPDLFSRGRCENVQYQLVKKDGGVLDVLVSAVIEDDLCGRGRVSLSVVTDITALVETKRLLRESEAGYRSLVEDQSELVSLATPEGELRYVNAAYASFYGQPTEAMIGRSLFDFVPEGERAAVDAHWRRVCATREGLSAENQVALPSGETRWMAWTNRALFDAQGRIRGIHSVGRDIQKRVEAERQLQESEARYRFLFEHSTDLILLIGANGERLYASPACRKLLGFEPEETVAMQLKDAIHPDDALRVLPILAAEPADTMLTYRMRRKDGSYVWVETTGRTVEAANGQRQRLVIVRDISARKSIEDDLAEATLRLQALVSQDALTGLANRRAFDAALAREFVRARRCECSIALVMIDVDWFKAFNDSYGHPRGDECLRLIAQAISRAVCGPSDLAARYGGEEFCVLLPGLDEAGAATIATRILRAVRRLQIEHSAGGLNIVTISAGAAACEPAASEATCESLVHEADRALYLAKKGGRNALALASKTREVPPSPSAAA